jgi:hypothetical protein
MISRSIFVSLIWGVIILGNTFAQPSADGAGEPPTLQGSIELLDGRKLTGRIEFAAGGIALTEDDDQRQEVGLNELRSIQIEPKVAEGDPSKTESSLLDGALPAPWRSKDVGRLVVSGRSRWKDHRFILQSSPRAPGENFSAFHMAYLPMEGNGEIIARVAKIDNPEEDSYGGILMSSGLDPGDHKSVLSISATDHRINFRRWGYQGGSYTGKEDESFKPPYWLKLVRNGKDVKAFYSPDNRHWKLLKVSQGKMHQQRIFVGLMAKVQKFDRLSEVVFDHVSVNGKGSLPAEPALPHVVLTTGSKLAADILSADGTSIQLGGRWKDLKMTTQRVARLEFFHPLPGELEEVIQGNRTGLLMRSGDFSEGTFQSLADGKVKLTSLLFGEREHSVVDEADALVLRKVKGPPSPAVFRVETHAGSILFAQTARLEGSEIVLEVAGIGKVRLSGEEVRRLEKR